MEVCYADGENGTAAKTTLIKASLEFYDLRMERLRFLRQILQEKKLRIAYLPQQIASFNAGFPNLRCMNLSSQVVIRVKVGFVVLNEHDGRTYQGKS